MRRTFEEMITYFNQTVSEMDIDRKYKMTLLGIVTALLQKHDEDVAQIVRCNTVTELIMDTDGRMMSIAVDRKGEPMREDQDESKAETNGCIPGDCGESS